MLTPLESQQELAQALEIQELHFKREDKNPYGSHKGRSIPFMMQKYITDGFKNFAMSSSGNAAIAAGLFTEAYNKQANQPIELQIFISKNINSQKYNKLKNISDKHVTITTVERPLQSLFNVTQNEDVKGLRQSNDDTALEGYKDLAEELLLINNLKAVFIPTSSGTTAQALAQYFKDKGVEVEIHIIQTMSCHPIANEFTDVMETDEISIADAIVDKTAFRKDALTQLVKESNGSGYVVTNEEITNAIEITRVHTSINLSPNSALSVAGLMQAIYTGKKWDGAIVCLITGQ